MSYKNDNNDILANNKKTTPPTREKVRNPFDTVLIENLHAPICSPGMCKIYKNNSNGSFKWDIDQACTLQPVDIEACSSQFETSPDPALERIAEEANEKFFSQDMVMPSPLETSKKVKPLLETSSDSTNKIVSTSFVNESTKTFKEVSAQTVLSLPPKLPPDIESILKPFCTYTQEQHNIYDEYEITANGSLRRKLFFEEHSDGDHYDSEHTDEEIHVEKRPSSSYEAHTPILFSPDLSCNLAANSMKRTFDTPVQKGQANDKPCYRNKILDVVDFGEPCFSPIAFKTPKRSGLESATSSSLASVSISPVTKVISSDEEKNNFTSPESEAMASCVDSVESEAGKKPGYFCKTPNKLILTRSTSLKESPLGKRSLLSERRSLSMSSLNRSRSVQKLDFSMDMSIDGSIHNSSQADSEGSPDINEVSWTIAEETSFKKLVETETLTLHRTQSSTKLITMNLIDDTPSKGKRKPNVTHEISKISKIPIKSTVNMSLDNSLDFNIPISMENKIDFNNIDLNFLSENDAKNNFSFKRVDSGFNENTFYANASSYYESAIKPSELTVTNTNINTSKNPLKEISNTNWMRVDSGFNENSTDSMQFYTNDTSKKATEFHFETKSNDKENNDFDRIFVQTNNEAISMSDIFSEELTFNCNFSSTPSKNKSRKGN